LFDRSAAGGAETEKQRREPSNGNSILFPGECVGERSHHARAEQLTELIESIDFGIDDGAEVHRDVPRERPSAEAIDCSRRGDSQVGPPIRFRLANQRLEQGIRAIDIAGLRPAFGFLYRDDGERFPLGHGAFDAKQVEHHREIELRQRRLGDGRDPCLYSLRWIVRDAFDLDRVPPCRGELPPVLVRDVGQVRHERVGHHRVGDAVPHRFESGFGAELAADRFFFRQVDDDLLAVGVRSERFERLGQALGAFTIGCHGARHERGDDLVGHPVGDCRHEISVFLIRGLTPVEHRNHRVGAQQAAGGRDGLERTIDVSLASRTCRIDGRPHQLQEGSDTHADLGGVRTDRLLKLFDQRREASGIGERLEQRRQRAGVEDPLLAFEAIRDDAIPGDVIATPALTQHFGVVDLEDLEMIPPAERPRLVDAARGHQIVRRARQQQQQRAPVLSVGARLDRQPADQSFMKQRGELANGGIRAEGRTAVDGEEFTMNGELHRTIAGKTPARRDEPRQRTPDGGMGAWV